MDLFRILVVDDHEAVRQRVRALLSSNAHWLVCGEAEDGLQAVELATKLRPDVVLMDISMPRMNGIEATRRIRRDAPESEVILMSQNDPAIVLGQAAELKAIAHIAKADLARDLLPTVESVFAGRSGDKSGKARDPEQGVKEEELQNNSEPELADQAKGLLAAIVDSSDDAIISKNLNGIIMSWNTSAERLFGYTCEEAIGQHITLIIPKDRRDEEANILHRLRRGERVDHFETVRLRKGGTPLDLSLTISPVKNSSGRVVGASKVARDISERKWIEQTLAERVRLLDLSNDAIFVRDRADRVTYWNKSACELYGYPSEEAMGRVAHELLRTEFPEPLEKIIEQLLRDNRWAGELVHRRKDGSKIIVASRWALDRNGGGSRKCILETNNDITQEKQREEALRESENRFRALTDDLEVQVSCRTRELEQRNTEILQQSEQLRELSNRLLKIQDEERRHIARELHDSAGQLIVALGMNLAAMAPRAKRDPSLAQALEDTQNLVQQLNREIRTTSYLLHPPLLDESGLPQAIQWYVQGLMERSGLEITLDIPDDFGRLSADLELAMFRILQECLTNIHRHSGSKTATIRLSRSFESVALEIQDNGKGIPLEKLDGIHAQRSGVGFAGMRERVRHLKGIMDIHSSGTGTTVSVTLPVSRIDPSEPEHMPQKFEIAG
jgi:PAS domain S-box-containing protein